MAEGRWGFWLGPAAALLVAQPASVVYRVAVPDPARAEVRIEMAVPARAGSHVDLRMATWSPGFYKVEPYAGEVQALEARDGKGAVLPVAHPAANRWEVKLGATEGLTVTYRLRCTGRTVTTNTVTPAFAVLNGPATWLAWHGEGSRPCEVAVALPAGWRTVATGLDPAAGAPHRFTAPDYDTLADAPLLLGSPTLRTFTVGGVTHTVAEEGAPADWKGDRAAEDLAAILQETLPYWGGTLPYRRYVFLNVFRPGGGGLEHGTSTLVTTHPARVATPEGYLGWLRFMAHEYVHAFNVKRLRPVELGPFDYERPPVTPSLWVSEGLTSYLADLAVARAGRGGPEGFLASLSAQIGRLQASPGRLKQGLAQSSREVWTNSLSGVGASPDTVSYYIKGQVLGFLLEAELRRRGGSLEHAMTEAYRRFGGARGFTPAEFQLVLEAEAKGSLQAWLEAAVERPGELDYAPALAWFGLRFAPGEAGPTWRLEPDPAASPEAKAHWEAFMRPRARVLVAS